MTKRAQLADGTILEFPDETPDEVMDRVVMEHVGSKSPANESDFSRMITGHEKPRSVMDDLGRGLGLTARYAVEGPLQTVGMLTDPIAVPLGLGSARQGAEWLTNAMGLPQPQGSAENVVGDISRAATGTGLTMGLGALAAPGSMVSGLAAQPITQMAGAATGAGAAGIARENGATPGQQAAIGVLGAFAPGAGKTGAAMGLRALMRGGEAGRRLTAQTINDFRSVGAQPSAGQATGTRGNQGIESLLAGAPTSSGVMVRAAENQAESLGRGLRDKADALYPNASAERAGRAVERGVDTFAGNVKAVRDRLYAAADAAIPPATPVALTNTQRALASVTTPNPGARATTAAMVNPKISQLAQTIAADLQAAGGKGLPYDAVREVRSRIGQELSDFALSADRPTAEYKRLYAALSADLEAAAKAQGPQAEQAMRRANGYFRASAERLTQLERVVDKAGGPEKVYAAVMSGTQDGGTTLRAVMQSLPKEGQRALTAAVIKRMGMATKGNQDAAGEVFSAQTFLTNWNGVSREAKRALFDRHGPAFVASMERIARVADRIRTGSKVYANPAGTANKAAAYTYAGSLGAAILTGQAAAAAALVGGGAGANITARMMTNPRFVDWLARTTETPLSSMAAQAIVLKGIARKEDDQEMEAYADALAKNRPKQ